MPRRTGMLAAGAIALLLIATGSTALDLGKIDLGRIADTVTKVAKAATGLSEKQEVELGQNIAASLLGAMPLVKDDEVQRYVNRIGQWLALQTERADLEWHFGVTDTETVGAFAAPGGYILITRGMLQLVRDEHELAGVLAHEIAHVVEQHHVKAIVKQARTELAIDVAKEATKRNNAITDQLLSTGVGLYARGLDREDELEADLDGVVIAARGGYDASGLVALLLTLDAIDPADENMTLLSSTHPSTRDRIDRLALAVDRIPLERNANVDTRFADMQARLEQAPAATPVSATR